VNNILPILKVNVNVSESSEANSSNSGLLGGLLGAL